MKVGKYNTYQRKRNTKRQNGDEKRPGMVRAGGGGGEDGGRDEAKIKRIQMGRGRRE